MKAAIPATKFSLWRSNELFNIDFASYSLSNHHFARHFHDHYVIELVVTGADGFYCNGKNYVAESNQLVLINPGEVHTGSTVSDMPLYYYSLYPDMKALEQVAASLDIALPTDFCFQRSILNPSLLAKKFKVFFDSLSSGDDSLHQQEIFLDCMYELLLPANYTNDPAFSTCPKDHRIQLVIDYIRSNFKKDISLQQLAGIACLNPFHLIRLFKKSVGVSPYDYLLITRAEYAKQLLRKGSLVQEAAIESGFYDSSHFNRAFSKLTGTSPKVFRSSKNQYCTSFIG
jgi:AraC-like DNA-binding protein